MYRLWLNLYWLFVWLYVLWQVHGSLQQLRRRLRAQGGATGLVTRLAGLQRKEETIQKSIANLHGGIEVMTERVLQADLSAFTSVREEHSCRVIRTLPVTARCQPAPLRLPSMPPRCVRRCSASRYLVITPGA